MTSRLKPPVGSSDHIQGPPHAPITLVEFGDYDCSFCGQAYHVVKALQEALDERLRFVFRHFPLATIHPHALVAAEAAEAAGAQGRFWDMHDLLYQNQDALDAVELVRHARRLGLDAARFASELRLGTHSGRIRADLRSGAISGVNGTPTFFINGMRHDGSWEFDSLWSAIAGSVGADPTAY